VHRAGGAKRIEFDLEGPVDVMVDGEVLTIQPKLLEVYRARWTLSHEEYVARGSRAILWMVCGIYFGLIVRFWFSSQFC